MASMKSSMNNHKINVYEFIYLLTRVFKIFLYTWLGITGVIDDNILRLLYSISKQNICIF